MDIKRTVLWVIFFVSVVALFDNWQRDHGRPSMFFPGATQAQNAASGASPASAAAGASSAQVAGAGAASTPGAAAAGTAGAAGTPGTAGAAGASGTAGASNAAAAPSQLVHFRTDLYDGEIDTRGGTLVRLALLKERDDKSPDAYMTLFDRTQNHTYLARTGLTGDFPNHNDVFTALAGPRALTGAASAFQVSLESPVKGGVKVVKTYTFTRGSYVIGVDTKVENVGTASVSPTLYMELVRDSEPVETPRFSHTFIGPGVYTNEHYLQKISFSDIDKNKADYASSANNGWIAMIQHYFATAWIPAQDVKRQIYVRKIDPALYSVGVEEALGTIAPGQSDNVAARLFAGPEEERMLAGIAPGLERVKDYGWFAIVAEPLFWLLEKIHSYVGNWGWSIILLTLLIKAVFFPLSAASYKSMARMKEITPRMQALRERFKGDPQKMNAALMELYKTEKVNPFGGCLPMVIQIPVFISLYWVLLSSVEMRGAPWMLWIHDLSQQDPFYILPVLMTISMFVQTRLNPKPPDPMQAKMMMFMPIAFSVMFFFFPAGLVLYYVVNNVLSIVQQYYITRMMGKKKKKAA